MGASGGGVGGGVGAPGVAVRLAGAAAARAERSAAFLAAAFRREVWGVPHWQVGIYSSTI